MKEASAPVSGRAGTWRLLIVLRMRRSRITGREEVGGGG
jgi:hypothetical protein